MTKDEMRELRKRLGLSAAKFGELFGVEGPMVRKWESGASGMSGPADVLARLLWDGVVTPDQIRRVIAHN